MAKTTAKTSGHLDGIHALVVEDINGSPEVLRLTLQSCGAAVTSVATAREAESLLFELRPHVLVTDIRMTDDGVTLMRAVGAMTTAQGFRVPTIAVMAADGRRAELLVEGFVEVMEKPLDPVELCRTIRRHLPRTASEAADGDQESRAAATRRARPGWPPTARARPGPLASPGAG